MRVGVIGVTHIVAQEQVGLTEVVLSAPEVLAFYVRQALWPIGPGRATRSAR